MHYKENNKYKFITQGLRPFSSSIPKTLKKYLKKGGYNYSNIVDNWTKMVNKGATVPELAASAGWSMDIAAKNMDSYLVTSGLPADAGHGRREKNIEGTEK